MTPLGLGTAKLPCQLLRAAGSWSWVHEIARCVDPSAVEARRCDSYWLAIIVNEASAFIHGDGSNELVENIFRELCYAPQR